MKRRVRTWLTVAFVVLAAGCTCPAREGILRTLGFCLSIADATAAPCPSNVAKAVYQFYDLLVCLQPIPSQAGPQPVPRPPTAPLALEVAIFKEAFDRGVFAPVRVADGDVLQSGDKLKVAFRPNVDCFVYIVQTDSTGRIYPLFPSERFAPGVSSPMRGGQIYQVPSDPRLWMRLDKNTGRERMYLVASRARRTDLEDILRVLDADWTKSYTGKADAPRPNLRREFREDRLIRARGPQPQPAEGAPLEVPSSQGQSGTVQPELFRTFKGEFVLMRWFEHH